jgi:hypothetical protein
MSYYIIELFIGAPEGKREDFGKEKICLDVELLRGLLAIYR